MAGNYRPVSLTSVVCKLLKKIIREHIIKYSDFASSFSNLGCNSSGPGDLSIFREFNCFKTISSFMVASGIFSLIFIEWKKATISAIFKKGNRSMAGNYRPVS
jgi:hypothetical protein